MMDKVLDLPCDKVKKILWNATQYAYSLKSDNCFKNNFHYREYYNEAKFKGKVYGYVNKKNKINACIVGISDIGLIIAFRGTEFEIADWINNIDAKLTSYPPYGNVHNGFLNSIESICDLILESTEKLLRKNLVNKIYITGHSKGGALAILMATKMPKRLVDKICVITFGSPRVGDDDFCKNYNYKAFRYESFLDLVPHLPFSKEELLLIPRLSPIYSKIMPITIGALKSFKQIVNAYGKLPPYTSNGTYICIKKPHSKFSNIPNFVDSSKGSSLNSLVAIEWMMRTNYIRIIPCTHSNDYSF